MIIIATIPSASLAARIFVGDKPQNLFVGSTIFIDGIIEDGDFEKFIQAVASAGFSKGNVFINSPGGNVRAAVDIGLMIRELRFSTEVPVNIPERNPICPKEIAPEECICASACSLIFIGGVDRRGTYIAVHRSFIEHSALKDLSLDDAQQAGQALETTVGLYLKQMGAPATLSELMLSVSSSDIKLLPIEYVQSYLQRPPEVDEWMIAKCGDIDILVRALRQATQSTLSAIRTEIDESFECRRKALRTVRAAKFDAAMTSAIAKANQVRFSPELRQFATHRPKNLRTLVGRKITDVRDELRWLGLGAALRYGVDDLVMYGADTGALHASINSDGTIASLRMMLGRSSGDYPK